MRFICRRTDHPHACGDKMTGITQDVADLGSSPRVWGQVPEKMKEMAMKGIIPTRVGTSIVPIEGSRQ